MRNPELTLSEQIAEEKRILDIQVLAQLDREWKAKSPVGKLGHLVELVIGLLVILFLLAGLIVPTLETATRILQ